MIGNPTPLQSPALQCMYHTHTQLNIKYKIIKKSQYVIGTREYVFLTRRPKNLCAPQELLHGKNNIDRDIGDLEQQRGLCIQRRPPEDRDTLGGQETVPLIPNRGVKCSGAVVAPSPKPKVCRDSHF